MGKLFVVPTPVGNLEDMTFRAIRVLKEADLILAEDTRTSGILLKHFEIKNAMQSHHKFNEHKTVESVVNRIKAGETVALISDAGTPGISDPGFLVVRECVRNGIDVLAGVVDADYRGEVAVVLVNHGDTSLQINAGDRIAQMVVQPCMVGVTVECDELPSTERGSGGFGSTGA